MKRILTYLLFLRRFFLLFLAGLLSYPFLFGLGEKCGLRLDYARNGIENVLPAYLFGLDALLLGLFFFLSPLLVISFFLLISYFLQLRGCKPPFRMARDNGVALREL